MSEMTDTMHLRLKELREYLKLKQGAISTQLGLKQSYYSDVENGKRPVTTRIIIGLRDKYNVSSEWLYTGWGEMFLTKIDIFVPQIDV